MSDVCFTTAAAEVLHLGLTPEILNPVIALTLAPVQTGESRARASVRYTLRLALSWGGAPWTAGVDLIDRRGYPDVWTFDQIGLFLVKNLPGLPCVVNMTIIDAARVPPVWTAYRAEQSRLKVAGLVPADILSEATAKAQSVAPWSASKRKTDVLTAAANMVQAVAHLRQVQALQTGVQLADYVAI